MGGYQDGGVVGCETHFLPQKKPHKILFERVLFLNNSFIYPISKFKHPFDHDLTQNMENEINLASVERKYNELSAPNLLYIISYHRFIVNFILVLT